MFVRLLPVIFADLLFAAHILRFNGILPALLIILLIPTLFIKKPWILLSWQVLTAVAIIEWIRTTVMFVQFRLAMHLPYVRLTVIMGIVILFNLFILFWLRSSKTRSFYEFKEE